MQPVRRWKSPKRNFFLKVITVGPGDLIFNRRDTDVSAVAARLEPDVWNTALAAVPATRSIIVSIKFVVEVVVRKSTSLKRCNCESKSRKTNWR